MRDAARVRFGIQTPNQGAEWDDIRRAWKTADSLGFHSAWVFDHFLPIFGDQDGDCFEGWMLLSAVSQRLTAKRNGSGSPQFTS